MCSVENRQELMEKILLLSSGRLFDGIADSDRLKPGRQHDWKQPFCHQLFKATIVQHCTFLYMFNVHVYYTWPWNSKTFILRLALFHSKPIIMGINMADLPISRILSYLVQYTMSNTTLRFFSTKYDFSGEGEKKKKNLISLNANCLFNIPVGSTIFCGQRLASLNYTSHRWKIGFLSSK